MSVYPSKEELDYFENWDIQRDGWQVLVDYLQSLWWNGDSGVKVGRKYLSLSTWGWSGNEEIIDELQKTLFWTFCWYSSRRGGHYKFELKKMYRYPSLKEGEESIKDALKKARAQRTRHTRKDRPR